LSYLACIPFSAGFVTLSAISWVCRFIACILSQCWLIPSKSAALDI
jgi:hypothetical protein